MARKHLFDMEARRISIRVPDHVDMALRLEALGRRVSPSLVAAEILESYFREHPDSTGNVMLAFPIKRQPGPTTPKPEKPRSDEERRKKHAPKTVQVSDREAAIAEGYPWTWDRLATALDSLGHGQHREIARALGLSNISVWARTGVPRKWWPKIREYLTSRGWEPTGEQPLLLPPPESEE